METRGVKIPELYPDRFLNKPILDSKQKNKKRDVTEIEDIKMSFTRASFGHRCIRRKYNSRGVARRHPYLFRAGGLNATFFDRQPRQKPRISWPHQESISIDEGCAAFCPLSPDTNPVCAISVKFQDDLARPYLAPFHGKSRAVKYSNAILGWRWRFSVNFAGGLIGE